MYQNGIVYDRGLLLSHTNLILSWYPFIYFMGGVEFGLGTSTVSSWQHAGPMNQLFFFLENKSRTCNMAATLSTTATDHIYWTILITGSQAGKIRGEPLKKKQEFATCFREMGTSAAGNLQKRITSFHATTYAALWDIRGTQQAILAIRSDWDLFHAISNCKSWELCDFKFQIGDEMQKVVINQNEESSSHEVNFAQKPS